jgi:hypothetical protein
VHKSYSAQRSRAAGGRASRAATRGSYKPFPSMVGCQLSSPGKTAFARPLSPLLTLTTLPRRTLFGTTFHHHGSRPIDLRHSRELDQSMRDSQVPVARAAPPPPSPPQGQSRRRRHGGGSPEQATLSCSSTNRARDGPANSHTDRRMRRCAPRPWRVTQHDPLEVRSQSQTSARPIFETCPLQLVRQPPNSGTTRHIAGETP